MSEQATAPKDEPDATYSIITIGDSGVGKTCLVQRFIGQEFKESHMSTVGIDSMTKKVQKDNKNYLFQIWDTTGQERFATLAKQYLRKAHGVVFVFAYNDRKSYESIHKWLEILKSANSKIEMCFALLGNKADMTKEEKTVTPEEGEKLGQELGMSFFDVSAKSGLNIDTSFNYLIDKIIETNKDTAEDQNAKLRREKRKKKDGCC